jgi:hypothetical protein
MPWWANPGADPNWRPPPLANPRPLDRLRGQIQEILEDTNGEQWFSLLVSRLPTKAIERFLDGETIAPDEIKAIVGFLGEFGRDLNTSRLIHRPRDAPPVSPRTRPDLWPRR